MNILYQQNGKATLVRLFGLTGISVCKHGDDFDPLLGIAIALLKLGKSVSDDAVRDGWNGNGIDHRRWRTISVDDDLLRDILAARIAYAREGVWSDRIILHFGDRRDLLIERFARSLAPKLRGLI